MEDKFPIWKPALIVAVIAFFALMLYPPSRKLKPGLDLAGGTTLVYQVDIPEGMEAGTAVDQVISSLRKRVDPQGVRNLVWRRLAGNRFEIQMALATEETKKLRAAYQDQLEAITEGNLSARQLDRIIKMPADKRDAELAKLAAGHAQVLADFKQMAEAYDKYVASQEPVTNLEKMIAGIQTNIQKLPADAPAQQKNEMTDRKTALIEQMVDASRLLRSAKQTYEEARDIALKNNVDPAELQSVLALPNEVKSAKAKDDAAAQEQLSPRAKGIETLKAAAPGRAEDVQAVADAFAAYEKVKGPLDDPADLIALLRGSGVLEFRIAPSPRNMTDADTYRKQLEEKGPRTGRDKPYVWMQVDRDDNGNPKFTETSKERKALAEDPVSFFASQNLIGQEYNGEYYVLLSNTTDASLTTAQQGWELSRAFADRDQSGFPAVSFRLNNLGGSLMADLTGNHISEPMAICLDGKVISAPRINDRIHGSGIITGGQGGFSNSELTYMIRTLNAGALQSRVSESPISIKTTGPQLGQDNLHAGMKASILSLVVVAVFMIVYYFFGGIVTVLALLANMVVILGVMAAIQATFTLPGIAGIILTIGMAVDANVLIFERIREELESGEKMLVAVRRGYEKALSTILDANITTLITCVVLYHTATADIKGFALVLGIGIVATLFTALFCTRVAFELWIRVAKPKSLPMLPMVIPAVRSFLSPKADWIGKKGIFISISVVMVALGIAMTSSRGKDMLDIEFRSGTEVSFELANDQTMTLEQVRERLTTVAKDVNIPELSGEQSRVVTVGDADGHTSNGFSIQTLHQDSTAVSKAVKQAFSDVLDEERPLTFKGVDAQRIGEAPAFIINQAKLGDVIDRQVDDDISDFLGGVAIVLDNIEPAVTEEDLTARIQRMRLQPAYEHLPYRQFEVIGLDLASSSAGKAATYSSMVIVIHDETTNYIDEPTTFTEDANGLATTEWHLVHDALTRDTSLGSVSSFSSQISSTMKYKAIQAMALSLLAVVIYIWLRFGKITYGLAAIIALVHDVSITLGFLAISYYVYDSVFGAALLLSDFKINLAIVAALLTIVGYSLNDTIVVFDRIRENRGRLAEATPQIINDSINQTISRTIMTSLTTLLAVIVLYIWGGDGVHGFAFAMLVGVFVGTYSSIAIASPILLLGRKVAVKVATKGEVAPTE
jgi:SecD/SecF fusion protein